MLCATTSWMEKITNSASNPIRYWSETLCRSESRLVPREFSQAGRDGPWNFRSSDEWEYFDKSRVRFAVLQIVFMQWSICFSLCVYCSLNIIVAVLDRTEHQLSLTVPTAFKEKTALPCVIQRIRTRGRIAGC